MQGACPVQPGWGEQAVRQSSAWAGPSQGAQASCPDHTGESVRMRAAHSISLGFQYPWRRGVLKRGCIGPESWGASGGNVPGARAAYPDFVDMLWATGYTYLEASGFGARRALNFVIAWTQTPL